MESTPIRYEMLRRNALSETLFEGIGTLFKQQHGRSFLPEMSALCDFLQKGQMVLAMAGDDVVGTIMYQSADWSDHFIGSLRHFVVAKGHDALAVGRGILETFVQNLSVPPNVIEFNGNLPHPDLAQVFVELGFVEFNRPVFRLRFKNGKAVVKK